MKNLLKISLLTIISMGLLFTACKKDEATTKTPSEILSAVVKWKNTKDESKATAATTWDVNAIDACSADDFVTYATGGAYTFNEGATKCDPADPQTTTGTWSISADGKILTVSDSGFAIAFDVKELTETQMVLQVTNFLGFGEDLRVTFQPL